MKKILFFGMLALVGVPAFIFYSPPRQFEVGDAVAGGEAAQATATSTQATATVAEQANPAISLPENFSASFVAGAKLLNPPAIIRGLYMTSWVAGAPSRVNEIIGVMKKNGLNAVVVDVKDYSGYVAYRTGIPEVRAAGAENGIRIKDVAALVKKFHENGIYAIARVTVFQDPVLAKAHPEWALSNKNTGRPWTDKKGLRWLDPAGERAWAYVAEIAKDALARGFDEVNFDYIRFPSDGNMAAAAYPFWDGVTPMRKVIRSFFKYLRGELSGDKISADLFGLTTVRGDDMGIGQVLADAYDYFDYVSPMVYPSHYESGFLGYKNPAAFPYEVISYSLDGAVTKRNADTLPLASSSLSNSNSSSLVVVLRSGSAGSSPASSSTPPLSAKARLRPWLQEFDLGAVYTSAMIQKEIRAVEDVLATSTNENAYAGWLLWDPSNEYARL